MPSKFCEEVWEKWDVLQERHGYSHDEDLEDLIYWIERNYAMSILDQVVEFYRKHINDFKSIDIHGNLIRVFRYNGTFFFRNARVGVSMDEK